jgi:hypothetical protein
MKNTLSSAPTLHLHLRSIGILFNTKRAPGGTQTASTERQSAAGANKLLIRCQRLWSRCRASRIFIISKSADEAKPIECVENLWTVNSSPSTASRLGSPPKE